MDEFSLIFLAAIGILSLILALWHGGAWERNNPGKLGFKWGYFVIYNTLINNIILFSFLTWAGIDEGEPGLLFFGVVALAVSVGIACFSILRQRWALVISTILSLNPLWMLVNIFYLKNRWPEFRTESSTEAEAPTAERLKSLPRDVRVALFAAVAWIVCVPSFVFLFQPYGRYMRDDDITHIFGVILLPVILGFGLFGLYRKFVK